MSTIANNSEILTIIPARMASTRLPGKPLANIAGEPMIVHVLRKAEQADLGPVIVACAEEDIKAAVEAAGGQAVMTDPNLPSGTDRVRQAADRIDPEKRYKIVINLQGDMPTVDPNLLQKIANALGSDGAIATAAVKTNDAREIADPNVVKAIVAENGRALYFTRAAAPHGDGPVLHHLGIYAYRRAALDEFCALPPSLLEQRERLEQLRALEAGMQINVAIVDTAPHGVDTADDLERARRMLGHYDG